MRRNYFLFVGSWYSENKMFKAMKETTDPNKLLAEKIFQELKKANLVDDQNQLFLTNLGNGKLKELDWKVALEEKVRQPKNDHDEIKQPKY